MEMAGPGRQTPDDSMIRIENPQLASRAFHDLLRNPKLGALVARLFDAQVVQVFFAHVTSMPRFGDTDCRIGWHQEEQYPDFIQGAFPTVWVPLRPISCVSGPLKYVVGSHRFGVFPERGIRSALTHEQQKEQILREWQLDWVEKEATGPLGMCTVHHSRTLHGTARNRDAVPRRAVVMHLRTEKNTFTNSANRLYQKYVDTYVSDFVMSPVIYGDVARLPRHESPASSS